MKKVWFIFIFLCLFFYTPVEEPVIKIVYPYGIKDFHMQFGSVANIRLLSPPTSNKDLISWVNQVRPDIVFLPTNQDIQIWKPFLKDLSFTHAKEIENTNDLVLQQIKLLNQNKVKVLSPYFSTEVLAYAPHLPAKKYSSWEKLLEETQNLKNQKICKQGLVSCQDPSYLDLIERLLPFMDPKQLFTYFENETILLESKREDKEIMLVGMKEGQRLKDKHWNLVAIPYQEIKLFDSIGLCSTKEEAAQWLTTFYKNSTSRTHVFSSQKNIGEHLMPAYFETIPIVNTTLVPSPRCQMTSQIKKLVEQLQSKKISVESALEAYQKIISKA